MLPKQCSLLWDNSLPPWHTVVSREGLQVQRAGLRWQQQCAVPPCHLCMSQVWCLQRQLLSVRKLMWHMPGHVFFAFLQRVWQFGVFLRATVSGKRKEGEKICKRNQNLLSLLGGCITAWLYKMSTLYSLKIQGKKYYFKTKTLWSNHKTHSHDYLSQNSWMIDSPFFTAEGWQYYLLCCLEALTLFFLFLSLNINVIPP